MVQFKTDSFKRHLSSFTFSLRSFWDSQRWSVHNSTDTHTTLTTTVDVSLYYDSHKILLPMDRIPTGEIVLPHRPERRQNDKRRRGTFPQKQSRHARRGSLIISILKTLCHLFTSFFVSSLLQALHSSYLILLPGPTNDLS